MTPATSAATPSRLGGPVANLQRRLEQVGEGLLSLTCRTPMVELRRVGDCRRATLLAKLECRNPGGSVKDRTALGMVLDAEESGRLPPDSLIVEPTAGNTGIGLAVVGRALGHRVVMVMPERYSAEKARIAAALGARVVRVPGPTTGMRECMEIARNLADTEGGVYLNQFENPANPAIHEITTGPEIWESVGQRLDAIVLGVGTGGTFTGTVRFLRRHQPDLPAYAVVPRGSLLGGGTPGTSRLEGIGGSFIPMTLDLSLVTEVLPVDDEDALRMTRQLARDEGLLVGPSSGASIFAALEVARALAPGRRVATLIADGGERYLSLGLHD